MTMERRASIAVALVCMLVLCTACGEPANERPADEPPFSVFPAREAAEAEAGGGGEGAVASSGSAKPGAPVIERLKLIRLDEISDEEGGGEQWRAMVTLAGGDPDDFDLEYRWWVNGEEYDLEDDTLEVGDLARGDTVAVEVRAFDGSAWSAPAKSGTIPIRNATPQIDSMPPPLASDGSFHYRVRASDRDEVDTLRFVLRTAPEGMEIDERSGVISWRPDAGQAGRHEVEVVVADDQDGETSQSFVLSLVETSDSASPPAQRAPTP